MGEGLHTFNSNTFDGCLLDVLLKLDERLKLLPDPRMILRETRTFIILG